MASLTTRFNHIEQSLGTGTDWVTFALVQLIDASSGAGASCYIDPGQSPRDLIVTDLVDKLPTGAAVTGVQVNMKGWTDNADAVLAAVMLHNTQGEGPWGVESAGIAIPALGDWAAMVFGGETDDWGLPADTPTPTYASFNSSGFGVALVFDWNTADATQNVGLDDLTITLWYTMPPPATNVPVIEGPVPPSVPAAIPETMPSILP
jgi:hypothetical protein